jgi:hypothetical protein
MLTPLEAAARWPGMRFDGPVLHQPDGGRVHADRTLNACWDARGREHPDPRRTFGALGRADGLERPLTAPPPRVVVVAWPAGLSRVTVGPFPSGSIRHRGRVIDRCCRVPYNGILLWPRSPSSTNVTGRWCRTARTQPVTVATKT